MREMTVQFSLICLSLSCFILWIRFFCLFTLIVVLKRRQIHPIIWFDSAAMHVAILSRKVLKINVVNNIL